MNFTATWGSLKGAVGVSEEPKSAISKEPKPADSSKATPSPEFSSVFSEALSPHFTSISAPKRWKFAQCFGEKDEIPMAELQEADIISTLEFDDTGQFLATGDCGGRAVLFERDLKKSGCEYKFFAEFQSHEAEFDYLKSLEIEEKINKIKWLRKTSRAHFLLTTNDKTIKLWKISDKSHGNIVDNNYLCYRQSKLNGLSRTNDEPSIGGLDASKLMLPKIQINGQSAVSQIKRVYGNAHAYHIHSISVNYCDGESFISADDLRIYLWNLHDEQRSFNIIDIKPANMEELSQVITCAEFSPVNAAQLMYSTSKGVIRLHDMRKSALCDTPIEFVDPASASSSASTYYSFNEIVSSISDAKFSSDGRFICSRDYMNLKVWDLRQNTGPLITIPVHEALIPKLCSLYEQDSIFDKFECSFNGAGTQVMTGSYNNFVHIYSLGSANRAAAAAADGVLNDRVVSLLADKSIFLHKTNAVYYPSRIATTPPTSTSSMSKVNIVGAKKKKDLILPMPMNNIPAKNEASGALVNAENLDMTKKVLHTSWHPQENTLAIASLNNLFIFTESKLK